eukprot:TRINITY_DN2801_c0_g3_i1.p1 TRINITY_DN2801_c0_g3~~TRINITY_DN2801_c0_g3_i1.p1  ORF type:complete len:265 (+),score=24.74 TRINITY_DN2801_c0_g3_i1:162-956(+)
MTTLLHLPVEILLHAFQFLDLQSYGRCCRVCTSLRLLAADARDRSASDDRWRYAVRAWFPEATLAETFQTSWLGCLHVMRTRPSVPDYCTQYYLSGVPTQLYASGSLRSVLLKAVQAVCRLGRECTPSMLEWLRACAVPDPRDPYKQNTLGAAVVLTQEQQTVLGRLRAGYLLEHTFSAHLDLLTVEVRLFNFVLHNKSVLCAVIGHLGTVGVKFEARAKRGYSSKFLKVLQPLMRMLVGLPTSFVSAGRRLEVPSFPGLLMSR